ncbi:uncharacterized protein K452DRAFT_244214 [Aplosporella prunicola CBS 121167]|uniref:Tetratricopeptide repeat protein 1 n=1 Tax=Aplosporella prunicola CBS 121167 TaxID=1176127 RepID=A0A6A6BNW9_9PEZI|nr:uncharacterized protein K452DRAFT_244214 [Aplosporella prunicola CBS 121167]KAF2145830.1 hypothetical protein K452DRAFT_244214 [Aplosporella prunicola CBS 121167]
MASTDPAAKDATVDPTSAGAEDPQFSPEEEASLLAATNSQKTSANALFTSAAYSEAIQAYDKALASCPSYLDYEIAVLRANIAACHLKLSEWKEAVDAASLAIEHLDRVDPPPAEPEPEPEAAAKAPDAQTTASSSSTAENNNSSGAQVAEIDDATAARIAALQRTGRSTHDVRKLRTKALLRRAKARTPPAAGWADLQAAQDDYARLSRSQDLTPLDRRTVDAALRELPPRVAQARQTELADMMGKLKTLGNGILSPFGLSTDNFQFVKDEKSGGYSMQFNK